MSMEIGPRVATDEVWNAANGDLQPKLWPNPNDGEVHLQLADSDNWHLQLIRIDGTLVAEWYGEAWWCSKNLRPPYWI
jgi:hypothetical protein